MEIRSISDKGLRPENQDNYWSAVLSVNEEEIGVLCVCDGVGGLSDGAEASRMLVQKVRNHFLSKGTIEGIEDVVESTNKAIHKDIVEKSGTTCTILMCKDGRYYIYNVGDSRCYRWNSKTSTIDKLTNDHTVIQKILDEGRTPTKEEELKYKNVLTRCVGVMSEVRYDIFSGEYNAGDMFLVCSDGFWHSLKEENFLNNSILDLESMVAECMQAGETDNITAGLLKV